MQVDANTAAEQDESPAEQHEKAFLAEKWPGKHVFESDGGTSYRYDILDSGEAVLVRCASEEPSVEVPPEFDGKPVSAIASRAFAGLSGVRAITCPPSVTEMGSRVFEGCRDLRTLSLPPGVDRFDSAWIQGCSSLEELVLPDYVELAALGLSARSTLRRLVVGKKTRVVGLAKFLGVSLSSIVVDPENPWLSSDGCALFTKDGKRLVAMVVRRPSYTVPDGCEVIGERAFAYDEELAEIALPPTLHAIEPFAFMWTSLESFDAPASLKNIGKKAFFHCQKLKRASLNEGLLDLGEEAFAHTAIESLSLPRSLKRCGRRAAHQTKLAFSGPSATFSIHSGNKAYFVDESGALYRRVADGCELVEMLDPEARCCKPPAGTIAIGKAAFRDHRRIVEVDLPEGLRAIEDGAFKGCHALRTVSVPDTLESIGFEAFAESSLESMRLPAHFKQLGPGGLCTKKKYHGSEEPALHEVRIHPNCKRYFMESGLLCEWEDQNAVRVIQYIGPQTALSLPHKTTSIAPHALEGARNNTELRIPASLRRVETCGMAIGDAVPLVILEMAKPLEGRTSAVFRFPEGKDGRRAFVASFQEGTVDAERLSYFQDGAITLMADLFERAKRMTGRLLDPFLLDRLYREQFTSYLIQNCDAVCQRFARNRHTRGFDDLASLGILHKENIERSVEAVADVGDVAMTGYILDLKRRRFGGRRTDLRL